MKKIFFILIFTFVSLFASELRTAIDYKSALEIAKKENKNIMLMLTQYGCPSCRHMKEITLKNEDVKAALSGFVFVDIDIHEDDWNKKFRVIMGTPTIYFINKNENKIGRPLVGQQDSEDFVKIIKQLEGAKK
jgi:thioredoxin-related protein